MSDTSAPYAPTFWTGVAPVEPGMPDRAFETAEAVLDRGDDDVVPHRARLRPQHVAVDLDARVGQPNDRQIRHLVGQHDIRAARQHQRPFSGVGCSVKSADDRDDRIGGLAGDQATGDRADAQGGQRRERHLFGDRYTPEARCDHGP